MDRREVGGGTGAEREGGGGGFVRCFIALWDKHINCMCNYRKKTISAIATTLTDETIVATSLK